METGELGEVVDLIVGCEGQRDLIKMMMMMMMMMATRKTLIEGFWSAGHYSKYFTYEN